VPQGVHRWGRFDPATGEVELSEEPRPGHGDLVDHAATQTLRLGGRLLWMKAAEMPTSSALAAILRG
jgi:hypothetical protein